jgi:protoheme ferro-lyase
MVNLTAAEMAELAEYTRRWLQEPHMTAKRAELDARAARRTMALRSAQVAFNAAMRNVSPADAEAINNYIRAIKL